MAASAKYRIVLCSGRPDDFRSQTVAWLKDNGIPFDALYMRAAGDYRADDIVKSQILDGILADGYQPLLVIDDRPRVVAMWRERGLTCLQCRDWIDEGTLSFPFGLLTIMVGPSGAGKSTWLLNHGREFDILPDHIVSTDHIRGELCGDFKDQIRNEQVWLAAHALIEARIKHGLPTCLDATNIRRKDRLAVVALAQGNACRYVVVNRDMNEKLATAAWRTEELIKRHEQTFRSQERDILCGDDQPNITVIDARQF